MPIAAYLDAVQDQAARDPETLRRFTQVTHLVRPPRTLLDPRIAARIGLARVRGPGRRTGRQRT